MEHGDADHLGGQILWRWRSTLNMGNTDSQLWVCRSYHFTSTCDNVKVVIALYSIHLVNLSMGTNTCVKPPGAVVKGPIMFGPQHANGHEGGIVIRL
jgi:hypothetical protein